METVWRFCSQLQPRHYECCMFIENDAPISRGALDGGMPYSYITLMVIGVAADLL